MDGVFTTRFTIDSGDAKSKEEIAKMISFSEIQPQFMYCGEDAVCLAGGRHVLIAGNKTTDIWWKCKCGCSWPANAYTRSTGCGCPECARKQKTSYPEQTVFYHIKQ